MESGLLRALTDQSAEEEVGQVDPEIVAEAPPTTTPPPSVAPRRQRSRVFVIAGAVAAIALTFDAWLITHHRRPTTPSPLAPAAPSHALPTYALLPLGTPPPSATAQSKLPAAAPATPAIVEAAAPAIVAPSAHHHRHGHHRH